MNVRVTTRLLVGAGQYETKTAVMSEARWFDLKDQAARWPGELTVEYLEEDEEGA